MSDKKNSRRKLLKSIAAGSGAIVAGKTLPEAWTKPVVDAVMLPVHAATTTEDDCAVYTGFDAGTDGGGDSGGGGGGGGGQGRDIYVCAVVTGSSANVTHAAYNRGTADLCVQRKGTIPIDGADADMKCDVVGGRCSCEEDIPASLVTNGNTLTYTLKRTQGGEQGASDLVIELQCSESCLTPSG